MECEKEMALFSLFRCLAGKAGYFLLFGPRLRSLSRLSSAPAISFLRLRSSKAALYSVLFSEAASCRARSIDNVFQALVVPSFRFRNNPVSHGSGVCHLTRGCSRRVFAAGALRGWFSVRAAKPPR